MEGKKSDHRRIIAWQKANSLDEIVNKIISKIKFMDIKTKSQVTNALDSITSNIVEGYYSSSTKEFLRFLMYSRRSCAELEDRITKLLRRKLVDDKDYLEFYNRLKLVSYFIDKLR